MAKIDRQELAKKSKSEFGLYQAEKENNLSKLLYGIFLKNTPLKVLVNSIITAVAIAYWLVAKNSLPLLIWFFYILAINIAGFFYWQFEEKRINKELARLETDLKKIKTEIADRQKYFEDLKSKIDKGEITS